MKRIIIIMIFCFCISGCGNIINKKNPDLYKKNMTGMKISEKESEEVKQGQKADEKEGSVKLDSVTATLSSGTDCHIYYFETSSKETNYKITRIDYNSGKSDVVISDDYAFYNQLSKMNGHNYDEECSIKTNYKKRIYIKIYPTGYYDMYAGEYKLSVSAKTDTEIKLRRYN